jgi:serine protease Do
VEDAENGGGVRIASVERDSPALRGGIRPGDVVLAVNGDKIETARGLIRAVAAAPPGNTVHLTVRRQGHEMELPIIVGRRPPLSSG